MSAGKLTRRLKLLIGGVFIAPTEIFLDSAREELVFLKHDRNRVAEHVKVIFPDINTADLNRTDSSIVKAGDELNEGRF